MPKNGIRRNGMTSGFAGRLLVVEDEPLVRMFAVDALMDLGFDVAEAGTGAQALEALQDCGDCLAALTDVKLPDRANVDWALELRSMRPDLPLLVLSGMDERAVRDAYRNVAGVGFLQKPYNQNALVEALQALGVNVPEGRVP
jgi:CheY-like chemotaxis protein